MGAVGGGGGGWGAWWWGGRDSVIQYPYASNSKQVHANGRRHLSIPSLRHPTKTTEPDPALRACKGPASPSASNIPRRSRMLPRRSPNFFFARGSSLQYLRAELVGADRNLPKEHRGAKSEMRKGQIGRRVKAYAPNLMEFLPARKCEHSDSSVRKAVTTGAHF